MALLFVFVYRKEFQMIPVTVPVRDSIVLANYNCLDNKSIKVLFYSEKADLTLSDGRTFLLLHAISASGARYTNTNESIVFWNKGNTAFITENEKSIYQDCVSTDKPAESATTTRTSQIANPASVNCTKQGGNLVIKRRGDDGEYGLCYFDDSRACEEWALLNGSCPVGGRKTTGYDTIDQNYCAWSGGQTYAVPNSVCTFKNGKICSTLDYYNGKCSPN